MLDSGCLNPFSYIASQRENPLLEVLVWEILYKWQRLILKERKGFDIDDIMHSTVETVLRNFNGDYGRLEAYVKRTALTIDLPSNDNTEVLSLSSSLVEDGSVRLLDTLTDDNVVGSSSNIYNLGIAKVKVSDEDNTPYWHNWLKELKESAVSFEVDNAMILEVIRISPKLETVNTIEFEEIVKGHLSSFEYKKAYNKLCLDIGVILGYSKVEVVSRLSKWLSLYLKSPDKFKRLFVYYTVSSKIHGVRFQNLDMTKKPRSARVKGDIIEIKSKTAYFLFELDIEEILDSILDLIGEGKFPFVLRFGEHELYNVLGNQYSLNKYELIDAIKSNIKRYVKYYLGMIFVAERGEKMFFESHSEKGDRSFILNYSTLLLQFKLQYKGKKVELMKG